MNKIYSNINNIFLTIFCFFPLVTIFLKNAIFFHFGVGICWMMFLIYRDSLPAKIQDFYSYISNNFFCTYLGIFAIYIIFNFYFISPYKSPTIWLQFFPFHVTSLFGLFLLHNAAKENFNDKIIFYSLSALFIIYLVICSFIFYQNNFISIGDALRSMSPFFLIIISCLLAIEIYRNSERVSIKDICLYTSIWLINFCLVFLAHGNVTKLIFGICVIIILLSCFFRKILFSSMILILLGSILLPIGLSKLKDFTLLNTKTFSVQIRSVQTRLPQWIKVTDYFSKKPITGYGVYASYFMEETEDASSQEDLEWENIIKKNYKRILELQTIQDKLNTEQTKILENSFLVEKTNQYYTLKTLINKPEFYDQFIKELKVQLKEIDRILEISEEIKIIEKEKDLVEESSNQVKFAQINKRINLFKIEKNQLTKVIDEYNTVKTEEQKKSIMQEELTRFLDYPQFKITTHPHNIFLQTLLELGAVGLVMLVWLLFFILYKVSKLEDKFCQTVGYILFFTFVMIYSTANSLWYIGMHQVMYIVAFLFIIQKNWVTKKKTYL